MTTSNDSTSSIHHESSTHITDEAAAEFLAIKWDGPPDPVGPEHVFAREELRRYYAVQAAGSIPNRVDGADHVCAVADYILGQNIGQTR